jgi:hypothetical protein
MNNLAASGVQDSRNLLINMISDFRRFFIFLRPLLGDMPEFAGVAQAVRAQDS